MGFYRSFYYYIGVEYYGTREREQYEKQKIYKKMMLNQIRNRGVRQPSFLTLNEFICIPIRNYKINKFIKL
tara:strand:- start:240 stop:452 length:213 start_codon:yes stop_codon:yes gene_type:complete